MDKVREVLSAIREAPLAYLPEKSIWALRDFLSAYSARVAMEGFDSDMSSVYQSLETWLGDHFHLPVRSHNVYDVVYSYSMGSDDAFDNFFALFTEFQDGPTIDSRRPPTAGNKPKRRPPKGDVVELLRRIRKRPALYIGYPHFAGVHVYVSGHEQAGKDLGLLQTAEEKIYHDFGKWVEKEEKKKFPASKPRPWFKLIRFYGFHDCGTGPGSAYSVFFRLLDNFAKEIGRQGLFDVGL